MSDADDRQISSKANSQWWGKSTLPYERWCLWRVSLLCLFIRRSQTEWQFAWSRGDDPLDTTLQHEIPANSYPDLDASEQSRYVLADTDGQFSLELSLADRPVVARPEVPVYLPSGQQAVLYVSTGIWLQPSVEGAVLFDLPIHRPSDTWFGPNTRSGEICYHSLTRARTAASDNLIYPHRAVTPITVYNEGNETLKIERIRVPVTQLGLHLDENRNFVTDSITLKLSAEEDQASLEIQEHNIQSLSSKQLSAPREQVQPGILVQAFARIFE